MKRGREQIALLGAGFFAVLIAGAFGYMMIEGWDPVESLYMTVITLTTVGFGEVHPLSRPGQVFTTVLILLGVGMVAYAATVIGQFLLDGSLALKVRRRRMGKRIAGLENHYIVVGYGRTGMEVVSFLRARSMPFVVVDIDAEKVGRLEAEGIPVLEGTGHDNEVLERAGIGTARAVIACAKSDAENVFITLTAHSMRHDIQIATRCEERESESKLRRAGATHVVNPYSIAGRHLIASIYRPAVMEFFESTAMADGPNDFQELLVDPDSSVVGQTIRELGFGRDHRVSILALRKRDGAVISNPGAETKIDSMDTLLALGSVDDLDRMRGLLERPA